MGSLNVYKTTTNNNDNNNNNFNNNIFAGRIALYFAGRREGERGP